MMLFNRVHILVKFWLIVDLLRAIKLFFEMVINVKKIAHLMKNINADKKQLHFLTFPKTFPKNFFQKFYWIFSYQ